MIEDFETNQMDLRYQAHRIRNPRAEDRLLVSIAQRGIDQPLEGVIRQGVPVLLNGFKRYRCARKLDIRNLPFMAVGADEAIGMLHLLRVSKDKSLTILEQASFVQELKETHGMKVAEIAAELSVSKAWVGMRLGLMKEMTPKIIEQLFQSRFPLYAYMYVLRPFMRMNKVSAHELEAFVTATGGNALSVRQIEQLAHGFFRGPESFRQQILQGNVQLPLQQIQEMPTDPELCSEFERIMLKDLEIIQKYLQRVAGKSLDPRLKSRSFHAQSHLLCGGILSRHKAFIQSIQKLHDRNRQA